MERGLEVKKRPLVVGLPPQIKRRSIPTPSPPSKVSYGRVWAVVASAPSPCRTTAAWAARRPLRFVGRLLRSPPTVPTRRSFVPPAGCWRC
eukprot:78961-Pyramimonas_sp.AAC.2